MSGKTKPILILLILAGVGFVTAGWLTPAVCAQSLESIVTGGQGSSASQADADRDDSANANGTDNAASSTQSSTQSQSPSSSGDSENEFPDRRSSPRATMQTFLEAINGLWVDPQAWDHAVGCLDFSRRPEMTEDQQRQTAKLLYRILNRIELINVQTLPDLDQAQDTGIEQYVYFPQPTKPAHRAVLKKLGEPDPMPLVMAYSSRHGWRFSATTVTSIGQLWQRFESLPPVAGKQIVSLEDWLATWAPPEMLDRSFLTLKYWQWIAMFMVVFVGVILDFTVRMLLKATTSYFIRRHGLKPDSQELTRAAKPLGLIAAAAFWVVMVRLLDLPSNAAMVIVTAARIFATFAGVWAAWRVTDVVADVLAKRADKTATKIDNVLVPLLRKALKIFIVCVGGIYFAQSLNIPIGPLVASLGIGSLAFAFAAKDTIENFFGSVAVLLDRPFSVGDWVVVDNVEGIVEEIGFRSTRVRTFYNSLVTVPNANLVRANVDNYGLRKYRRWSTHLGVQYDTSPDQVVAFTEGIRQIIRSHPYTRKDYFVVRLHEFAGSSINILLYVFWEVPDWSTELRERERLFLDIMRLADQLGVQFAFPTTTVHLFQEEHRDEHRAEHELPQSMTERRAAVRGIRAARDLMANQPWQDGKPGPVTFEADPVFVEIDPATGEPLNPEAKTAVNNRSAGG